MKIIRVFCGTRNFRMLLSRQHLWCCYKHEHKHLSLSLREIVTCVCHAWTREHMSYVLWYRNTCISQWTNDILVVHYGIKVTCGTHGPTRCGSRSILVHLSESILVHEFPKIRGINRICWWAELGRISISPLKVKTLIFIINSHAGICCWDGNMRWCNTRRKIRTELLLCCIVDLP